MTFETVESRNFFELLYADAEFCSGLGKVMLSAGILEANLRSYLTGRSIEGAGANATLGRMVALLKEHGLLTRNGEMHFDDLVLKRNYLAHSIYDLFAEHIAETILPRSELTAGDVDIFSYRAHQLAKDLLFFAEHVMGADHKGEILL